MRHVHTRFFALAPMLALALTVTAAPDAAACGGTFCDSGPKAMPVDQTGENILFVLDGKSVEAHVQIQYSGDPARFAWIVPMPAVPTVTVGSEQLFTNVLGATVPSYGFTTQRDFCPCASCGFGAGGSTASGGSTSYSPAADAGAPGVNVIFQKTVGAFEVTALSGHTSQEVLDWLTANGYQSAATAPALLDGYVKKGSVFVAVKLTAGAGTSQIHPLVFKYTGTEACIPLQLTAVAAVDDMSVRAFFLGDDRVVSTNYSMVALNPARLDWLNLGKNYKDVVSRAVDSVSAGHAFLTEYAGASSVVAAGNLASPLWDEGALSGVDALGAASELEKQGLLSCDHGGAPGQGFCTPMHPLVFPLLHEFVPPPATVDDATFYASPSSFAKATDYPNFDAAAFSNAVRDRIFTPGRHAAAILGRYPYLTRLYTTISPAEMNDDPVFEARTGLSNVSLPTTATQRITASGVSGFTLPDGRAVGIQGSTWPPFSSAMPWAERIEQYPAGGKPVKVLADNASTIDAELGKWNSAQGWPAPPLDCGATGSGGFGAGGAGGAGAFGSGSGGAPFDGLLTGGAGGALGAGAPNGGTGGVNGSRNGDTVPSSGGSGGCSVPGAPRPGAPLSAVVAALGVLAARASRRRSRPHVRE